MTKAERGRVRLGEVQTSTGPGVPPPSVCFDCPAYVACGLVGLVRGGKGECAFETVAIEAKTPLPEAWFAMHAVAFVRRGLVVRQRIDRQGRAASVDLVGAGGLITLPEERAETSCSTGVALTRLVVCLCSRETFSVALKAPELAGDYLRLQLAGVERLERIAEARLRSGAVSAVGGLLCALADTLFGAGPTDLVPLDVQQRTMAELLGLRHETVCRALKTFEARGWVAREDDGWRLVDRIALERCEVG